jgi:hypothetical protein
MKQKVCYEPTKAWLESKGFHAIVTGTGTHFIVPISDLFSAPYKVPDIVGVDGNGRVVIAEVETVKEKFFEALGRCMLWRCLATFVYLVYPKGKILRAPFISRLGIGLLEVDDTHTATELIPLPTQSDNLFSILELHPTDFSREQHLAEYVRKTLT